MEDKEKNLSRKKFISNSTKYGIITYGISSTTSAKETKLPPQTNKTKKKKILVNVFHPNLKESRINKAMMSELKNHPNITVRDIYKEYGKLRFIDTIPLEKEKEFLKKHDRIAFQHPIYWYNCTPLMKKWIEDILLDDWDWGKDGNDLKGKDWLHAVSCAGDLNSYRPGDFNGHSLGEYLRSFQQTSVLCKMNFCPTFAIHHVYHISDLELKKATESYVKYITSDNLNREYEM